MPKISVEIPGELLDDLDEHVGDDGKFVNRSDAIRASVRKTLDVLDEIDARHGRLDDDRTETTTTHAARDTGEEESSGD
jgi:Arc/MetJ-type ribon-helix-helix transcriptional regulator